MAHPTRRRRALPVLAAPLALLLTSCGGGEGNDGLRHVRATLGASFQPVVARSPLERLLDGLLAPTALAVSGTRVDAVAAIPLGGGGVDDAITVPVNADGSIDVGLDPSWDWLLLLINSTLPVDQRVVGFLTLPQEQLSMVRLPISAAEDDLDMGQVERSGDEAASDQSVTGVAPVFSLSVEELLANARTDDAYKLLINRYLNPDYRFEPAFTWAIPLASLGGTLFPDAFVFQGYSMEFFSSDPALADLVACEGADTLELVPPAPVQTALGTTVTEAAPFRNDVCGDPEFFANQDPGTGEWHVAAGGGLMRTVPDGPFRFLRNDALLAAFEVGVGDPNAGGHLRVPVPDPELVLDAGDVVQSISITWRVYDPATDTYPASSSAEIEALIQPLNQWFVLDDGSGAPSYVDNAGTTLAPSADVSSVGMVFDPAGTTPGAARSISFSYRTEGARYTFTWGEVFISDGPDLVITDVVGGGGLGACPSTYFDLTIENQGNLPVTLDYTELAGSTSADLTPYDPTPGAADPVTLEPLQSTVVRLLYAPTLPITSLIEVPLRVDPLQQILETDEGNNAWAVNPTLDPAVQTDLSVTAVTFTPNPATAGQSVSVEVEVSNVGGFDAYVCAGYPLFGATVPGGSDVFHVLSAPLLVPTAGAVLRSTELTPSVSFGPGTFPVTVTVDPQGNVVDSTGGNDAMSADLVIN